MNLLKMANEVKTIIHYRKKGMAWQRKYNRQAPQAGDLAPDFTLYDTTGTESVTLSNLGHAACGSTWGFGDYGSDKPYLVLIAFWYRQIS